MRGALHCPFDKLRVWPDDGVSVTLRSRERLSFCRLLLIADHWPHLVWAGGGVYGEVEEIVLEVFSGGGEGLVAGGGGDDGEELEIGEGGAGDVYALGVGACVWRGEEEAVVVGERV